MINTGMFLHTPRRATYEMLLKHKDVPGDGTGFLQSYINKNRHTLDERMRICDLDMMYNLQVRAQDCRAILGARNSRRAILGAPP